MARAERKAKARSYNSPSAPSSTSRLRRDVLRDGLMAVARQNRALSPQIERMAKAIRGSGARSLQYEQALITVESEFIISPCVLLASPPSIVGERS
jgi:hypothetical protein